MATIDEIKQQAAAVKNATQVGENTAERVGGALDGLAEIAEQQDSKISDLVAANAGSVKSETDITPADANISDEKGNILVQLYGGHIKTKNFDSRNAGNAGNVNGLIRLKYFHWNIGHFNGGKSPVPTISNTEDLDRAIKAYRFLFNNCGADIVGLCEYSKRMANIDNSTTYPSILSMYKNVLEGKVGSNQYVSSALFSRDGLEFTGLNYIDLGRGYYGMYTTINVCGKEITICELHAPWQTEEDNKKAITILVDFFKRYEHVILSGDFNTLPNVVDNFKLFTDDGWIVANNPYSYIGNISTYPSGDFTAIDNILVKGGSILHTEAIYESVVRTFERKGDTESLSNTWLEPTDLSIKIGRDYIAPDGNTYNLSDHLPLLCDITF